MRRRVRLAMAMVFAGCLPAQHEIEPLVLQQAKSVEYELSADQVQDHYLVLKTGEYGRVKVTQLTINIALTVFDPSGAQVFTVDNNSIGEAEHAELIATVPGKYRVRVTASEAHAPTGRYRIDLTDLAPATERHKTRIAAARELSLATATARRATREAMLEAVRHFAVARSYWGAAEDPGEEARALYSIAFVYIELGDREKALANATEALPLARTARDSQLLGRVFNCIGEVYNNFSDRKAAIDQYMQALPLLRAAGDRDGEGQVISNLGVAYSRMGEKRRALELFDQSMQILRAVQDRRTQAEVAGNTGVTYDDLGNYQRALENHQFELKLRREMGDRAGEGVTQNNIGSAYSGLAEYQKALDAYLSALEINRSYDSRWNMAVNLNNIGWVYAMLGDKRHALSSYQESLDLSLAIKDPHRTAIAFNNIANVHSDLGDYRKAIELQIRRPCSFAGRLAMGMVKLPP